MKEECRKCPFIRRSPGYNVTTVFCIMPRCMREFDRKIRQIEDEDNDKE